MKKVLLLALAIVSLFAVSCNKNNGDIDWDKVTVNGFYVAGPATGSDEIKPECVMVAGVNEAVEGKPVRDGMFEKYIVLEADKEFYLLYNDGGNKSRYGANLAEFVTPEEEAYGNNPASVLKGAMVKGDKAPAMKVSKTGLYHIVLDINKTGDLDAAGGAQILLLDASDFGVRGGMNGWGFTSSDPKPTFSNDGTTFTFKDQELAKNGEFKFSTGNYWKVTLDDAGKVKAEVSLGETGSGLGLANRPGRGDNNIVVEKGGKYDITLTFKLAQGGFDKNFTYTVTCTQESSAPETMYMNGGQWGGNNWDWASDGIVELSGIPSAPGLFWCTRWFDASQEFKFCAVKAWNGDFGDNGNNCKVPESGFYTVFVDGNNNKVEIMPAEVYGIGDAWGANAWDFNAPDAVKFVADGQVLKATVNNNSSAIRLASKVTPSAPIEGVTTANGWIDWWKTEFVYFDGKIAYRGAASSDQERVAVEAGKEITIDFNAGTVTVGEPFVGAIAIDGDMSDWAEIEGAETPDAICKIMKVTNDEKFFYVYLASEPGGRGAQLWGDEAGYYYVDFDWDNNEETGIAENNNPGFDCWFYMYVFGGTADAPIIKEHPNGHGEAMSIANVTAKGVITADLIEIELSIPRADMVAVPAGAQARILSWRSKDGTKITQVYTVK